MIQIIKENRKPTTTEKFNQAFSTSMNALGDYQTQQKEKVQYQQENDAAKRLGIDLSGIRDPKMRQEALGYALQAKNQQQLEQFKQQGEENLIGKKQSFLSNILGGNQSQTQTPTKNNQPNIAPQGNVSGQENINNNQKKFNPAEIPDAAIAQAAAIDPAFSRELRSAKDTALREARAEKEFNAKQDEKTPGYQRQVELTKSQAKADTDYYNDLQSRAKKTVLKNESLERIEKVVKKGVSGKPIDQMLESLGLISKTSEGRRELAAEVKNQYTDFKDVAGSQLSGMEFQVLSGAYPNPNFSKEANLAIIKNLKIVGDTLKQEHKIAEQLKKDNGGKLPEDYQSMVNSKLFDYISTRKQEIKDNLNKIMYEQYDIPEGKILMFIGGNTDEPISVLPEEVEKYEELGAVIP